METPQVVEIIRKCGLSNKTGTKNILKMAKRNDIRVDVVNKTPIREDRRKQRDQASKYYILKNRAYYVHRDW